jgi:predicted nuclease of predicted toxin-antitoxin system
VKLLFDENVSPRLTELVREQYPDSEHVRQAGLVGASDARIWKFARENGYVIVSKDDDFRQRSFLEGAPPKVVWLQVGNAGTQKIADLLIRDEQRLLEFEREEESALLILRGAV